MHSVLLGFLLASLFASVVYPLECGLGSSEEQDEVKRIFNSCLNNNDEETNDTSTDVPVQDVSEEQPEETIPIRRGVNPRNRRSTIKYNDNQDDSYFAKLSDFSNNSDTQGNCIVNCVFQNLGLTDPDGVPQHNKVSEALLKNANDRELRDFLQDAVDECFHLIFSDKSDACGFSTQLMTCLAEKGRQNCADWPVGNIPFPH